MLYNLTLNLTSHGLIMSLTVATLFLAITLIKEKKDERKRA